VPAVDTSTAFYLTTRAPDLSAPTALAMFAAGLVCIAICYESDHQRYIFRSTNGNCRIWGAVPKKIVASYPCHTTTTTTTTSGVEQQHQTHTVKQSLLLVDGWWKYSRRFQYVPEIMASFFWSAPALAGSLVGPYTFMSST
jgi:7-dehydrocholesterol reductase